MKFNTTTIIQGAIFVGAILLTACGGTAGGGTVPPPLQTTPVITTQPRIQYVKPGNTATFTVVATGTGPLHYQWKRNGTNIGGDVPSYTTPTTTTANNGEKYLVAVSNAAGSVTSGEVTLTMIVDVPPGDDPTKNQMGINFGSSLDWETNRVFADVMKTSRNWMDTSVTTNLTTLDGDGWPQQDASIPVWHGIDQMHGTYALSFTGRATIDASWGAVAVTDQVYNANTNQTTAKVVYANSDRAGLLLTFTNTQRTAGSATNTGITNVVLKRPTTLGGNQSYTTEVFNTPFISALSSFTVLRAMDFTATNWSPVVSWSDRTRPTHASQAIGNPTIPAGGWQGRGAAWEYAILLANQTGKDLWINIPAQATDDYITKLAQLIMYGSDGATPYTSTQASPVWPGLDPGLRVYVEFSNELWNTAFQQTFQNHDAAVAEVNAGGSPLNFDGEIPPNDWNWACRRVTKRTVEISTIFRTVGGDSAMMTHIRPVLMSQLGYADGPLLQAMHMLVNYYGNPDRVASPHLPNYYIYGVGGSSYYGPSDESSVNAIFSSMAAGFVPALQADANWALAFGLKRIAYEGGPGFDTTGNATTNGYLASAWNDSRMTQVMIDQHNVWSQNAGDLLVYFTIANDYQWGFMPDVLTPSHPKMDGIHSLNAAARSASTYGAPIPATLAATSASVPPTWAGGGTNMANRSWLGFAVHVSAQGAFNVVLNASSAAGAQAEVLIDGNSIGTVTVPGGSDSAALTTPSLSVGSHGILVRNTAGTFNLDQIKVTAH